MIRCATRNFGERKSYFIAMAPSHAGMCDPFPSWNIEIEVIWNIALMSDNDPRSLVGNIANEAGEPFATVVELNPTAQAPGLTSGPAPLVHLISPT